MKLPDWTSYLWNKKNTTTTERPSMDEQRELVERAERLDRLIEHPGWEDVCRYMVSQVQSAIADATRYMDEPDLMRTRVIIWNAKRELLDNMQGYVEGIRKSRDDLVEQFRRGEQENG